jgi:parallel beta-helix repeat protein
MIPGSAWNWMQLNNPPSTRKHDNSMKTNCWFNHSNRLRINLRIAIGSALMIASAAMLLATGASAATRYVTTTGTDTGDCTNAAAPCRTITYGVAQATAGDTVSVAAGTYTEADVTIDKQLTVIGHDATLDARNHDAGDQGFIISGPEASGSVLQGFIVVNAGLEGIFAWNTSNLTISGNTLVHNDAYGPFSEQCANQPDDCGEALHLQSVTNSVVSGNRVHNNVGGILLTDEDGPTAGNVISENRVFHNTKDCGITLASHFFIAQCTTPVPPGTGGVYQNQVLHNTSNGNGAAGIGFFAGPPGAAAWGNVADGNTAMHNGLPGVAIHSHTPCQNANDNVVINNRLAGNGPDGDAQTVYPTGVSVFSDISAGADPIQNTTISNNTIKHEYYGIYTVNALNLIGLDSNTFINVTVPISMH